ncbi:MAG: hypothetical protein FVQ86_08600 [candidate division NC10 bacterium]|jgi:hypothetical protein|nr:hypothetical protein [candidate division NC10 bacterium]
METGIRITGRFNRGFSRHGGEIPGTVSPLTEWVGIGFFVLLFAWVLAGIWMVLVHGVLLPPEAICLRG